MIRHAGIVTEPINIENEPYNFLVNCKKCEVACLQQIRVLFCLVSCFKRAARHILCHVASRGGVCHILGTASRITY